MNRSPRPGRPLRDGGQWRAVDHRLFFVGILDDFVLSSRDNKLEPSSVGLAFTTVHILLAVGLLLVDNLRHARRADL